MSRTWLGTNQAMGVILVVGLGALYLWLDSDPAFHRKLFDGFSLGFIPTAAIAMMMVFSAVLIVDSHRNERAKTGEVVSWATLGAAALIGVGGFLYIFLLPMVGFLLLTPVYIGGLAMLLGMPLDWPMAIAVVAITVVVYAVFWLLGFPVPSGILAF